MNVFYYCQHVLGIGHFHRSVAICRAIAEKHRVTLILGGPPVDTDCPGITILQLPGLKMNANFQGLAPCEPGSSLAEVKKQRQDILMEYCTRHTPDIFITELYPFGRKAFRFELDPLLEKLRTARSPRCYCFSSVRDILVEKTEGSSQFEQRAVKTLNRFYDGVLVHADPRLITLDATFSLLGQVKVPIHYTGFVTKPTPPADSRESIRNMLQLTSRDKLIVASIGGGNVGGELLLATMQAVALLTQKDSVHLQVFSGPYCPAPITDALLQGRGKNMRVDRFTSRISDWFAAADLSVSMAGYNTCMDVIQAGIPALLYPFRQNREQRLRAEKLATKAPLVVLDDNDLDAENLSCKMQHQLMQPRSSLDINVDGAHGTVRQLENWIQGIRSL